MPNNTD